MRPPAPVGPAGPADPAGMVPASAVPPQTSTPGPGDGAPKVPADAELAARLRLAVTRLSRRIRRQVAGGLTSSQVSALAAVERLGVPTLGELAASEQVQPPSMTRLVLALEAAGLVSRLVDERDRRMVRVAMTSAGRRVLQRSRSLRTAYLVRRLQSLSDIDRERLEQLVMLLEQLVEP